LKNTIVVKIGGNIIDDKEALASFLTDFSKINSPKLLIHGGGKLATQLCTKLNIVPNIIDGRRITDRETLDVVTMVYGGLINKQIVAQLQAYGCNAIGLTGADANCMEAHKRQHATIDYGFVGDIDKINADFLRDLLQRNITPVLAPLTHDKQGTLLNTNADTIAASVAVELSKQENVTFVYCFEKRGLLQNVEKEDSVLSCVTLAEIEQLKEKQIITGGMLPKVENIVSALNQGVEKVILCHAKDLLPILNENSIFGTTFTIN
jgi:acetylglutamate kinase